MTLPTKDTKIVIVGRGKVGQGLTQLFKLLNYQVINVGRSIPDQLTAIKHAHFVFLCVNDASITSACEQLAPNLPKGCIVSHCSGALDSSVLKPAQQRGCATASTHPLNTFPNLASSLSLLSSLDHGSYLYAEGDPLALTSLLPLFDAAGFVSLAIERQAKPLYHAACVFACNYLTSLMDMSLETASKAGLEREQFWNSLQPIIQSTIDNISHGGVRQALSGPIARGDTATLETHLHALDHVSTDLKSSYADLGVRALEIAIRKKELSDNEINSIRRILDQV